MEVPTNAVIGGRYTLVRHVADGGMASVWHATAHGAGDFHFPVAIKILKPDHVASFEYVAMFLEEVRIGSTLHHPHIVEVIDFCEHAGMQCLVMEWVDGISLLDLLVRHLAIKDPIPWYVVAHIGIGVLRGLGAAHRRQLLDGTLAPVIHRDVSPSNVLLGVNGAVKLADFGVARARDRVAKLTAPNIVKGKVSYLAPELARGGAASPRSDLYSFACTLWEVLAGQKLFQGASDTEILLAITRGLVPRLDEVRPELPDDLVELVHAALALDPNARPVAAREMIDGLNHILRYDGPSIDAYDAIAEVVAGVRGTGRQTLGLGASDLHQPTST